MHPAENLLSAAVEVLDRLRERSRFKARHRRLLSRNSYRSFALRAPGTLATSSVVFTSANWNVAQTVTVTAHVNAMFVLK